MSTQRDKAMESAGRLYKISMDVSSDPVEKTFAILKFASSAPLEKTLELYHEIKNKWRVLAEITTAKELTSAQKAKVEQYLADNFGPTICYLYNVDKTIIGGIKVRVGDNVFDESIVAKIRDLTL